jgi:hypothetical protein
MVPLSVLDLSPITEGGDAGQALRNSPDLARWGPIRRSSSSIRSASSFRISSAWVRRRLPHCFYR